MNLWKERKRNSIENDNFVMTSGKKRKKERKKERKNERKKVRKKERKKESMKE